jgi:hypothetical protein
VAVASARAPCCPFLRTVVAVLLVPLPAGAYVTREPDLWQLGTCGVPELPAVPSLPTFPLVSATGGPEDLGVVEFTVEGDIPRVHNQNRARASARERLETWLEENGESVLERRREPVIHAGELVIAFGEEELEHIFPLDDTTTPQDVALASSTEEIVSHVFRYHGTDDEHAMNPKLIALLAEASYFFQVPIKLVSGFRPRQYCTRRQSHHIAGEAADIKLEGIPMNVLADYFTVFSDGPYGPMGVGRYPHDGFVHVDSREETYFWTGNEPRRRPRHHHTHHDR